MTTLMQYLGYQIDAHGIHQTEAEVRAIMEAHTVEPQLSRPHLSRFSVNRTIRVVSILLG